MQQQLPEEQVSNSQILDEVRKLDVKIEKVDSNVAAVAEQHTSIKQTLDSHTEMIGSLMTNMTLVKNHLNIHIEPSPV